MLPHPIHPPDPAPLQRSRNLCRRRLQRFFFLPQPHRLHNVPHHPFGNPARNRLHFRQFRHICSILKGSASIGSAKKKPGQTGVDEPESQKLTREANPSNRRSTCDIVPPSFAGPSSEFWLSAPGAPTSQRQGKPAVPGRRSAGSRRQEFALSHNKTKNEVPPL